MPMHFDAATIERARVLVETTPRTLEDIAVELGTSVQTLRNWIKRYGWRRHPKAPRAAPKLPPAKEGPARRIYEGGARVGDLAALLECHESYVHRLAKQRGWLRPRAGAAPEAAVDASPPSEAMLAIMARMRDPALSRSELMVLLTQAMGVTAIEAVARAEGTIESRLSALWQFARHAKHLPDDPPPPPPELSREEHERRSAALAEELARRWGVTLADPPPPAEAAA